MVEIKAKATHSKERAKDFFKFHLFKINPIRHLYYMIALALLVLFVVFLILVKYTTALFFLFLSILVLIVKVASTNILINKIVKKINFPSVNYYLNFTKEHIVYSFDEYSKKYSWIDVLAVYEIDNYFYFYITKNSALILPKFTIDEDKRKLLRDIINDSGVNYTLKKYK